MGQQFQTTRFLGVEFARCDIETAVSWVEEAARRETFGYVVTPNVDHLVMHNERGQEPWRRAYREAVADSDLCINDSRILSRLARLSGLRLDPLPGSDLAKAIICQSNGTIASFALVGGSEREARWLGAALPDCRVVHFVPPMGVRDNLAAQREIARFIERQGADCVILAIGAPQSEIVAHAIARRGRARGVALCIGASIEFLSGAKRRAPRWLQAAGFEWLFRLITEPRRLWKRYLVRGPRIFAIWWKARKAQ